MSDNRRAFSNRLQKENLYEISNDNGMKLVNFAISKNLIVESVTFLHCDNHKHNWIKWIIILVDKKDIQT
jgi:hypothetical protein